MNDLLRNIPSVTELLESPAIKDLLMSTHNEVIVEAARASLDELRHDILAHNVHDINQAKLIQSITDQVNLVYSTSLQSCINATGIILHTGLGRAPLAAEAVQAMTEVGQKYSSVEIDLDTGKRSQRVAAVEQKLTRLFGGEAAAVVNNNAGATMLALAALSSGKETIVSRGELVEIGGSFRMPDVMKMSQAILCEVGTTNKTRAADYEDAIGERGQVYSRIRPNESGEIQVAVDGTLRTLTARAKDKSLHLSTGDFIRVLDVIGSTLIVEPLDIAEETEEE